MIKNKCRNKQIMKSISIYIHIPFCIKKCNYCDFLSAPADESVQKAYLCALKEEIQSRKEKYKDYLVKTVFIGGGTPTAVDAKLLCEVLQTVKDYYTLAAEAEISMEANPGTVTKEALLLYKEAGINRLSIGLQSADNEELKLLGRIHSFEDFLHTYQMAVEAGFENINVDLMAALPGQTVNSYQNTLQKVLELTPLPKHISAYSLIIEEGTPFFALYGEERAELDRTGEAITFGEGNAHLPTEEAERRMYELTGELLSGAGYERYEISNYSKPGASCKHNCVYWQRGNYVGFGLGAASLVENVRFQNTDCMESYLQEKKKITQEEHLTVTEQMEEFMFLGLRMIEGVSKEQFQMDFGVSIESVFGESILKNINAGLLEDKDNRLALTEKGLDVANYVMSQFLIEEL